MKTGLETGYGTRAVDRDLNLFTGTGTPLDASSDATGTHLSKTDAGSEPILVDLVPDTPAAPPPTILKDSDGDEVMNPPSHESDSDDLDPLSSMSKSIVMGEAPNSNLEEEMFIVDAETGPAEDFEVIEEPSAEPSAIDEEDDEPPVLTGLESEENFQDVSRRKGESLTLNDFVRGRALMSSLIQRFESISCGGESKKPRG